MGQEARGQGSLRQTHGSTQARPMLRVPKCLVAGLGERHMSGTAEVAPWSAQAATASLAGRLRQQTLNFSWFWSPIGFWQGSASGLPMAHLHGRERETGSKFSDSYQDTNPSMGPPWWPHLTLVTALRPCPQCHHAGE